MSGMPSDPWCQRQPAWRGELGGGQGTISEFGGRQFIIVSNFFWNIKNYISSKATYFSLTLALFLQFSLFPLSLSDPALAYPHGERRRQGEERGKEFLGFPLVSSGSTQQLLLIVVTPKQIQQKDNVCPSVFHHEMFSWRNF